MRNAEKTTVERSADVFIRPAGILESLECRDQAENYLRDYEELRRYIRGRTADGSLS
jgi:hypothetical protein